MTNYQISKYEEELLAFGQRYTLQVQCERGRKRTRFGENGREVQIMVANQRQVKPTLTRWYRKKAREYYVSKVQDYGVRLGVHVLKVAVSDARSQWGSCIGGSRRVSLQWRLALAPLLVADYVIAHEVAHLREVGHSAAFWRLVESVDGDYQEHRRWLRKFGHTLVL